MPRIDDWLRMYASDNRSIQIRAAKGLLERSGETPLPLLIDILIRLSHEGLGHHAEKALVKRKDKELAQAMIELLDSEDVWLREAGCRILGHTGDTNATKHLLRLLDDPHPMVRRAAGFGLAFLKDPSSLEQVRLQYQNHREDDTNVVWALECALRSLGDIPNRDAGGG